MKELLTRGRTSGILLVIATIALVAAVIVPWPGARKFAFCLAALAFSGLLMATLVWSRQFRGEVRKLVRDHTGPAGPSFKEIGNAVREVAENPTGSEEPRAFSNQRLSIFAPGAIPPAQVLRKPNATTAGRGAADQIMADDGWNRLESVLDPDNSTERLISVLAGPELVKELSGHFKTQQIVLSYGSASVPKNCSDVVVDEDCASSGNYGQLFSTSRTRDFLALMESLQEAKKNGAVVYVCPSENANHFSNTLYELADVIVGDSDNWATDFEIEGSLPAVLRNYANKELNTSE